MFHFYIYPLKMSENQRCSDILEGMEIEQFHAIG